MPHLARVLRPQRPPDMVALTHLTLHRNYRAAMLRCLRDGDFDMRKNLSLPATPFRDPGRVLISVRDQARV